MFICLISMRVGVASPTTSSLLNSSFSKTAATRRSVSTRRAGGGVTVANPAATTVGNPACRAAAGPVSISKNLSPKDFSTAECSRKSNGVAETLALSPTCRDNSQGQVGYKGKGREGEAGVDVGDLNGRHEEVIPDVVVIINNQNDETSL